MKLKKGSIYGLLFILLYIAMYYLWLIHWKDNRQIMTLGGAIFSIVGCLIAVVWLFAACKRTIRSKKTYWLLLSLGCLSYTFAEFIWMFYENILKVKVPFPGYPDLFYLLQILLFLIAFVYKLTKEKRKYQAARFLFDAAIIMTVAATFSWKFIISAIVTSPSEMSAFPLLVSLAYPIGDLALLFGAISIYFGTQKIFSNKEALFLISGLLIQIFADSSYMYLTSVNQYSSGSLIDPLSILGILFVGFTGRLYNEKTQNAAAEIKPAQKAEIIHLSFPYFIVTVLLIFMFVSSYGIDAFSIGSSISILLLIIRQILIIIENQQLLHKYYKKSTELAISEQRYKSLFEYHPDAVFSIDLQGNFDSMNAACANWLGYEKEELIGLPCSPFIAESRLKMAIKHFFRVKGGTPRYYEISVCNRCNEYFDINIIMVPIIVKEKIVGVFGVGKDITEMKKKAEQIKYLAYHDSLTKVPNRALFEELLKDAAANSKRNKEMFAIMFIDLDGFKMINDTLGHGAGDQLLVSVSKRLKECIRENDIVARIGGDEFILLIKGISHSEDAALVGQKILDALNQPQIINGYEIMSTPSIGIAIYPIDGLDPLALIKKADMAMYQVKENGKGNFRL